MVLRLGTVNDFDVWVWLVLWFDWVDVVESRQCLLYCVWHCEVYSLDATIIIPLERYAAVSFSFPIDRARIVFLNALIRWCASSSAKYLIAKLSTTSVNMLGNSHASTVLV